MLTSKMESRVVKLQVSTLLAELNNILGVNIMKGRLQNLDAT